MRTAPDIMQRFYRSIVANTLEEVLNNSMTDEVRELANKYWAPVESEVPAPPDQDNEEDGEGQERTSWISE
jgi:hypothetical protein